MKPIDLGERPRILLVRTDKIGDLLTTLPALESLRRRYPKAHLAYLCRAATAPLLLHHPAVDAVFTVDGMSDAEEALPARIRRENFDAALHFFVENRSALLTWRAGIPLRIGPFSKPAALFLNRRFSQHRSRVEKHEVEYNLDLACALGADGRASPPRIFLTPEEREKGAALAARFRRGAARPLTLLHPGSAGSAKDWPPENFEALARRIAGETGPVLFTFGPGEKEFQARFAGLSLPEIFCLKPGELSLREFASLIAASDLFVSNSTGPLHIAAALGIKTLSFYPRLPKVMSKERWGPYGEKSRTIVLDPDLPTAPPASIPVEIAFSKALELLKLR